MTARAQDASFRSGIGVRLQPIDVVARAWLTVTLVEMRLKYRESGVASLNMAMLAIAHPGNIRDQLQGCPAELSQTIKDTAREAILRVFSRYIRHGSGSTIEDDDTRGVLHTFLNADLDNNDPHNYNEKIAGYLGPGGSFVQYAKELKHTRLRWHGKTKDNLKQGSGLPISAEHCQIARQGVINWFNNSCQGQITWTFSDVTDVEDPTLGQLVAPHSSYCLPPPRPSGNFVLNEDDLRVLNTLRHMPLDERGVAVKQEDTSTDAAGPSGSSHQSKRTREFTAEQVKEMIARAQPSTASTRAADPAVLPPGPNSSGSPDRHKRALEHSALELTDEDAKELIRKLSAFKARRRRGVAPIQAPAAQSPFTTFAIDPSHPLPMAALALRRAAHEEENARAHAVVTEVTRFQEAVLEQPPLSTDNHKQLPKLVYANQGKDIESAVQKAAKMYCRDQSSGVDSSKGWVQEGRLQRAPSRSTAKPSDSEGAFPGDVIKSTVYHIVNFLTDDDYLGENCLLRAGSSFLDIGSGYGNVVFQVATCIPTLPCVGIEYKKDVWQKSREILATLRLQGSRLDNVALYFGEAAQSIANSGGTFTHIYFFDKERNSRDLQQVARALAPMPFKIFCSAKTERDWAECGLFLTEIKPKGRNIQFTMAASMEAKKVHFYKKDALPEAVAELLEIIRNFLFCGGHNQTTTTLGVRAILQAFSPLSRWALGRDDESDEFVFPPLASGLGEDDTGNDNFHNLLLRIHEAIANMTDYGADVARWAITDHLLAWPHYPPELRYDDLDLTIDLPELKGLSTFSKLQKILYGNLEGVTAPWKKKLEDNLFKWKVDNYGPKKGWGLAATEDLVKGSYIAIYGGMIFDKNKPPRVQTHVLHFTDTQTRFAIDGYIVHNLTKIAQGALANDSRRKPNAYIDWVKQSSLPSLSYLSSVPILRLSKDVSAGTEIVFKYSPNSQYPASINYEE